jgi:hypothetical protein
LPAAFAFQGWAERYRYPVWPSHAVGLTPLFTWLNSDFFLRNTLPPLDYFSKLPNVKRGGEFMAVDLKDAVLNNMKELRQAISEKSFEVTQLQKELKRYETVLALLSPNGGNGKKKSPAQPKGRSGRGGALSGVLTGLPETFSSREFMKAALRTKRSPVYLRQLLSRWAKQGRIRRVQRGKYQKGKGSTAHRAAA